jgi:hypothetical protein
VPQVLTDWCKKLPELAAPPVIDGVLECPLSLRPVTPLGYTATGTPDATADYAIAWYPSGLYFFVAVHDPLVVPAATTDLAWEGDAVELFADSDGFYPVAPAFDDPGTRQFVIAAPAGPGPSTRGMVYLQGAGASTSWTSTQFVAEPSTDGYVVEAFITAADLGLTTWTLVSQGHLGFDLAIDVSYPTATQTGTEGHRLGQYFFNLANSGAKEPYRNVGAFCNPSLALR